MTNRWSVHDDATAELLDAVRWYDSQQHGVGEEFLVAVAQAIRGLQDGTKSRLPVVTLAPELKGRIWRALLTRFPYAVIFVSVDDDVFQIVAFAHLRRQADYWRDRVTP